MKNYKITLDYYDRHKAEYVQMSSGADMSAVRKEFMDLVPVGGRILDCGCGSGRDTLAFSEAGYRVVPMDGSEEMCRATFELTGIKPLHMLFSEMDLKEEFDGIWACASLLHVPKRELPDILQKLSKAAKKQAVLYMSFRYGTFEGILTERYYSYYTENEIIQLLNETGNWKYLKHNITGDSLQRSPDLKWLNVFCFKD